MSTGVRRIAAKAKEDRNLQFRSLAHLVTVDALRTAYRSLRKDAAPGIDGVTWEQYGIGLESKLQALHARLKAGEYRAPPVKRVRIPKDGGKTRPIGIPTTDMLPSLGNLPWNQNHPLPLEEPLLELAQEFSIE